MKAVLYNLVSLEAILVSLEAILVLKSEQIVTYVFKRFLKFCERGQARLDDAVGPLADLGVSVPVASDRAFDRLLDDVGNLVHHELGLEKDDDNIDYNV